MKQYSGIALFLFTLGLMSALSVLYWSNVKEKLIAAGGLSTGSQPVFCSPSNIPGLALTFDLDGQTDDVTDLLSSLKNHQVKATFFVTGEWLKSHTQDVKKIAAAGHELGNHTEHHPDMTLLNEKDQTEELMSVHNEVSRLSGISMQLFRPPYGSYDNSVIQNARKNGYLTVTWNVDSQDWKDYGTNDVISAVCENENLQNGSIILFHGGARYTSDALDTIIPQLKEKGYRFSTVSQLLSEE
ncbi:MAG: polysaccharide deacetylase family protein [Ruminococcus sp.]|jgi:peptidoglycan/xylan/chitin deacetylase (PgdA/CDA1 family)